MAGIAEYIEIVLGGDDLSFEQAGLVLDTVFGGEVPGVQIAALLAGLRAKGESVSELAGFAGSLRGHAVRVDCGIDNLVDTCGTGGAKLKTFNISTAAAFVAAGAVGKGDLTPRNHRANGFGDIPYLQIVTSNSDVERFVVYLLSRRLQHRDKCA